MNEKLEEMNTLKNDQSQLVKPLVCVRSMTFNHAPYIADAMNGFCMQKTSFPFVCAVIDDCSTDGEQEVISNYLHEHFDLEDQSVARYEETDDYKSIYARHKENHNCFFVVLYLKYNHYSIGKGHLKNQYIKEWYDSAKYIALCEGDDYWIDPLKLQKQVDYMEVHPECSICFARVVMVHKDGRKTPWLMPSKGILEDGVCSLDDFTRLQFGKGFWVFHTSSFFYRQIIMMEYEQARKSVFRNFPYGDITIILYCLTKGKGYYIDRIVSCYRLLSGGYNSNRLNNPELDIKHGEMLIQALWDFNNYTGKKYEKYIKKAILRCQCGIDRVKHRLYYLNIKYLPLLSFKTLILLMTRPIKSFFPSLYSFLKRIYWKFN